MKRSFPKLVCALFAAISVLYFGVTGAAQESAPSPAATPTEAATPTPSPSPEATPSPSPTATPEATPSIGMVNIVAQIEVAKDEKGKPLKLLRKRFFLIRGSLKQNEALLATLKKTLEENGAALSRDNYYNSLKTSVSPEFLSWLRKDNSDCETPYCREITDVDIQQVPEFRAAHARAAREYGKANARRWITTKLPADLRFGYYRRQRNAVNELIAVAQPVQSAMTDNVNGAAVFLDIPVDLTRNEDKKKKGEIYTVTNLLPIEVRGSSYVWACEIEVKAGTSPSKLILKDKCIVAKKALGAPEQSTPAAPEPKTEPGAPTTPVAAAPK